MTRSLGVVALAVWLTIVVDQVDGSTALVEWSADIFGTLPTGVLPSGVREGDRVQVRVRRRDLRIADAHHGSVSFQASVKRSRPFQRSPRAESPPKLRRRP